MNFVIAYLGKEIEFVSMFEMKGNHFVWTGAKNEKHGIRFGEREAKAVCTLLASYGNEVEIRPAS